VAAEQTEERRDAGSVYEYSVTGNYAMEGVLSGARAKNRKTQPQNSSIVCLDNMPPVAL
jgi:hypothetical protein